MLIQGITEGDLPSSAGLLMWEEKRGRERGMKRRDMRRMRVKLCKVKFIKNLMLFHVAEMEPGDENTPL